MFTADGELREEFRRRQEDGPEVATESAATAPAPSAPPPTARPDAPRPSDPIAEPPGGSEQPGAPAFFDLVGLLAQPASIYLQEARAADPQTAAQSLELARLHIELLVVLRNKTRGNLSPDEQGMLEDVLLQLRSDLVGLRG